MPHPSPKPTTKPTTTTTTIHRNKKRLKSLPPSELPRLKTRIETLLSNIRELKASLHEGDKLTRIFLEKDRMSLKLARRAFRVQVQVEIERLRRRLEKKGGVRPEGKVEEGWVMKASRMRFLRALGGLGRRVVVQRVRGERMGGLDVRARAQGQGPGDASTSISPAPSAGPPFPALSMDLRAYKMIVDLLGQKNIALTWISMERSFHPRIGDATLVTLAARQVIRAYTAFRDEEISEEMWRVLLKDIFKVLVRGRAARLGRCVVEIVYREVEEVFEGDTEVDTDNEDGKGGEGEDRRKMVMRKVVEGVRVYVEW